MSSWWSKHVVGKVIRCGCRRPELMAARHHVLGLARGDVFELGCGDGINIPLLNAAAISSYTAIEPDPDLRQSAQMVLASSDLTGHICHGYGEDIPFADASFDTVLCTFTLCSVHTPKTVLSELRRILKPDGQLLYAEHGLAPDPAVQKWQRRIDPLSTRLLGNCHMSREISQSFINNGFETHCLGAEYANSLPSYAGWIEWGIAKP